jgi:hypothetical protein
MQGQEGEFTIEKDGYRPDEGDSFSYSDHKHKFWFFVKATPSGVPDVLRLKLHIASTQRFGGALPTLDEAAQRRVENNLKVYFETHDIFERKIGPSNPAPILAFEWKFRRPA